tara:strand:- start:81881 stop:81991 length:111 start_codon:yes stop_codon:yes gene_type:complete
MPSTVVQSSNRPVPAPRCCWTTDSVCESGIRRAAQR